MTAFERIVDAIQSTGAKVKQGSAPNQINAQCPAHEDREPSLTVTGIEGQTLVYCHAGCEAEDVVTALGLTLTDLFDEARGVRYDYTNSVGTITRTVSRSTAKKFTQSGDTKGKPGLYRLPLVIEAVKLGGAVYLVEGEKDVHAIETMGAVATTTPMGAANIGKADLSPLHGASVIAVIDDDEPGQKWAGIVHDELDGKAKSLTFVKAKVGKDAADHIAAGHGLADFEPLELEAGEEREIMPRLWSATDLVGVEQPKWLARQRLPRSAVTILVGDEGIGKSLLWVWIVAAVTTGSSLEEFGIPAREPEDVVIVITEDEWSYTVLPRLQVAGADLSRIKVICTEKDGSGSPVFPRDMWLILEAEPALVIVDAFLDTVPGNLQMKDPQQARKALHPWKEAATITGAAIMLLTHTNRVDSKNARDKYGITGELRKKARMTLFAQQDDEGFLVVGPEKSNIVGKVLASKFTIAAIQKFEATEDHDGTVPLLTWVSESTLSARDLIEQAYESQHGEDSDDRNEAEQWLSDYIAAAGGSVESKDAKRSAKAEGISDRTLKRAAKALRVQYESTGFPRTTMWTLDPSRDSGDTENARLSDSGLTGPTGLTGPDLHKRDDLTEQSGQSGQWGHAESDGPDPVLTDDRPPCPTCNRAMGKADAELGQCIQCRRITEASTKVKVAS